MYCAHNVHICIGLHIHTQPTSTLHKPITKPNINIPLGLLSIYSIIIVLKDILVFILNK